ncbi:MAG: Rne/Rng family ribonuclease, partial [Phycisphaerae bacterium]|nr:Rne/Rng family ribonuclease [Phycisphaerae bacterium]MDW8262988.1 Rne/Rng family ribonuclease [Phycisphaerales bacterium]
GIGTKGPTLSTYVSIPGRILVMMPGMSKFGISRKIEDEEERRRLRQILDSLKCPEDVGFIVRTAGVGKSKAEISRDLQYLTRLWKNINDKLKLPAPVQLYTEGDLVTRTVRDVFSSDIERIVVDNKEVARKVKEFFKIAMPRTKNRVELYEDPIPLFHKYNIEQEIERIHSRHVPLPSGGSLVIDSTEAIVAIDVNSGKFRDHSDAETTAFRTDMEAADEIPRQLKLRDLGGVIICDFIDLRFERHRREVEKRLHENLKKDRAKTKVLRMSQFGIIEMTRQRMRPSLKKSIYCDCPHCKGSGLIKTSESMALDMMRRLMIATTHEKVVRVELAVHPEVAFYLLNKKRRQLSDLETERGKKVLIRHDASLALDEFRLTLYDNRDGLVYLSELGVVPPQRNAAAQPRDSTRAARQESSREREPSPPQESEEDDRFDLEEDTSALRNGGEADSLATSQKRAGRQEPPATDAGSASDQAPSQVVDIEDGAEPMGEAPREFDESRNSRGRGRRVSNRSGRSELSASQRRPRPQAEQAGPEGSVQGPEGRSDLPEPSTGEALEPQVEPAAADEASISSQTPGGGRRRRRRRRGGRGRGGGGSPVATASAASASAEEIQPSSPQGTAAHSADAPYDDPNNDIPAPGNEKDAPTPEQRRDGGKKRRRRGGRRHRQRRERAAARAQQNAAARLEGLPSDDEPPPTPLNPPPRATAPPPPIQVVSTGTVDKHLADDEPVDYQPPRRPRSYHDLDELPDFDD